MEYTQIEYGMFKEDLFQEVNQSKIDSMGARVFALQNNGMPASHTCAGLAADCYTSNPPSC